MFLKSDDGDGNDHEDALDEVEELSIDEAFDNPQALFAELEQEFGVSLDTPNIQTVGDLINALHQE